MVIPRELEVTILRLHHAEDWPIGTIVTQLQVHHDVVERVLSQAGAVPARQARPTMLDPYLEFVRTTWEQYPKLSASRLWAMCRARGYPGARDHFRHMVANLRPQPRAEAYLRLRTLPAEQAQIDWAHFGKVEIGRAKRPVLAFVAVLSWSRALFVRFFLGQHMENFLRGHEGAFQRWNGVPRVLLYDNLKSAVVERIGNAIRLNPTLLDFAGHYHFEPRPVAPGRGNEKPRVERAIRYLRSSFFMARKWRTVDELNALADEWCEREAMERPWPDDPTCRVRQAFEEEQPKLLALPETPYCTDERREVGLHKTPYVRFDGNDYSVPHELVGRTRTLVVLASLEMVRVFHDLEEVASHPRSYDRRQQIEDPAHIRSLIEAKRAARSHRGVDRLTRAAPSTRPLLERLAERGERLGNATRQLGVLLDCYGAERLEHAVAEALAHDSSHIPAVRLILEREHYQQGLPPALPNPLVDDPRVRNLQIPPHSLDSYDNLSGLSKE